MTNDPASLQNLHDIVVPDAVSWWPLATGWWVTIVLVLLLVVTLSIRRFKKWRANAYRRAALAELGSARSTTDIAAVLRRTALAIAPRDVVAGLHGEAWADWLGDQAPVPIPEPVRGFLTDSIYDPSRTSPDPGALRDFTRDWIRTHVRPC